MLAAKIYVENGVILVLECTNKESKGVFPRIGSRFGCLIRGEDKVAISKEAKVLFKHIVYKAEKRGDDVACLDVYKMNDQVVVSWIGDNVTKINYDKLKDGEFWVGADESYPQLILLDNLIEVDNKQLQNLDINSDIELNINSDI